MSALHVRSCGPMTSLQDTGRFGSQRYGVSTSGAMDTLALAVANTAVGNGPGAAAIEFMLLGGTFALSEGSARVALAGASAAVTLDGKPIPASTSAHMRAGQTLVVGPAQAGIYSYLAVCGGFDIAPQLGSLSLQARARMGGFEGRALQSGDELPLLGPSAPEGSEIALDPVPLDPDLPIRVVLGPQDDYFTEAGIGTFLEADYAVSPEADRMGYRLTGPKIEHAKGFNIVSDGIVTGSIQVPGAGEPIVMMADRQTTGGYPKIATVISADLRVMAHRRPGDPVRFMAVSMAEAQKLARERASLIASLPATARAAGHGLPGVEELLAMNLAGAAVDGLAPEH